jgi:hypothetical protein
MLLSEKCNFHISAKIAGLCLKQCQLKDKKKYNPIHCFDGTQVRVRKEGYDRIGK